MRTQQKSIRPMRLIILVPVIIVGILPIFTLRFLKSNNAIAPIASVIDDNFAPGEHEKKTLSSSVIALSQLTRSHIRNVECPEPLVPLYDRIVEPIEGDEQRIPRSIHLAWIKGYRSPQSRCISRDMMEAPLMWMKNFPTYSLYFHDDEAVDTLLEQDWPEFPQLNNLLKGCVKYGQAMRIDIWRILLLYRYGGFYADFDVVIGPKLLEPKIETNFSAFFLSDAYNRPSQWLHAMEPNHPIAFFTMLAILRNLQELENVAKAELVRTTGPDALKEGYTRAFNARGAYKDHKKIFDGGVHVARYGKLVCKKKDPRNRHKYLSLADKDELFPYPRNVTNTITGNVKMITKKERIMREMNTIHWSKLINEHKGIPGGPCIHHLYINANNISA